MSDNWKSKTLRGLVWAITILIVIAVVLVTDATLDKLPIWPTQGQRYYGVESAYFWGTVGIALWRWISRRVHWSDFAPPPDCEHKGPPLK